MRFVVVGASMEPSYKNKDQLFVSKLVYNIFSPKVGDVVVVKDPRDERLILKRIKKVQNNRYFVAGDNPPQSSDSRHFGPIAKTNILGKVLGKLPLLLHQKL